MSDIIVYHITFHEAGIDVVYSEERDLGESVIVQRQISLPSGLVSEQIKEMMPIVQDAVDTGLVALQNAGQRRPPSFANLRKSKDEDIENL